MSNETQELRKRLDADLVRAMGAAHARRHQEPRDGLETWKDARDTLLSLGEFLKGKGYTHPNLLLLRMEQGAVGFGVKILVHTDDRSFEIDLLDIQDDPEMEHTVVVTVADGILRGRDTFYRNDRGLAGERIDAALAPDTVHVLHLVRDVAEAAYRRGDVDAAAAILLSELTHMADTAWEREEILLRAAGREREPDCDDDTTSPFFR